MKKLLLLVLLLLSYNIYSQTSTGNSNYEIESIHIDKFYENKTDYLIYSKIITLDSTNSDEIIKRVKNWGGVNFVNFKEVLISETSDQLVINYIDKSFFIKTLLIGEISYGFYVRLVIQVKNNKLRLQFYDDGNAPSLTGQYSLPARTYYFKDYFSREDNTMCVKTCTKGLLVFRGNIISSAAHIEDYVKKPITTKDDW